MATKKEEEKKVPTLEPKKEEPKKEDKGFDLNKFLFGEKKETDKVDLSDKGKFDMNEFLFGKKKEDPKEEKKE